MFAGGPSGSINVVCTDYFIVAKCSQHLAHTAAISLLPIGGGPVQLVHTKFCTVMDMLQDQRSLPTPNFAGIAQGIRSISKDFKIVNPNQPGAYPEIWIRGDVKGWGLVSAPPLLPSPSRPFPSHLPSHSRSLPSRSLRSRPP